MLAGGPEPGDAGCESALGRWQVAAEPFGYGQKSLGDGTWQRFFPTGLGQHTPGQLGCGLGVTAELGEIGLAQCLQRGKVHQQAGRPLPMVGSNGSSAAPAAARSAASSSGSTASSRPLAAASCA